MKTLLYMVWIEFVRLARVPAYVVPVMVFPIMFYAIFGLNRTGEIAGVVQSQYVAVSFSAYTLLSTALFSFGVTVAAERAEGWSKLLRITPLSAVTYFGSKTIMALLQGFVLVWMLIAFAAIVGKAHFDMAVITLAVFKLLLGTVVFVLVGLWIGYVGTPNSAAGIANVIFLPLSFASGLFIPLQTAPEFIRTIAPYTPTYHFAQIGWATLGAKDTVSEWVHWAWLLGYGVFFGILVFIAYQRDESKNYG